MDQVTEAVVAARGRRGMAPVQADRASAPCKQTVARGARAPR
jgi:hypothetical protein